MRRILAAAGALALSALLALATPREAAAAPLQMMAFKVTACPASVIQAPVSGNFIYVAVDQYGNVCTSGGGGGGSGGAVTAISGAFVDCAIVTIGCEADVAWTSGSGTDTALFKALDRDLLLNLAAINAGVTTSGSPLVTNSIQVCGSDGTDCRNLSTDTSGHLIIEPGNTANTTPWLFQASAVTSGGATPFHLASSAATNNATLVSTGAHTLYALVVSGVNTAIGDFRLYDSPGSPTCSSATGVVLNIPVITTAGLQGGMIVPIPAQGMLIANGLAYCVTGANADNDNTNAPTGVTVNGLYK